MHKIQGVGNPEFILISSLKINKEPRVWCLPVPTLSLSLSHILWFSLPSGINTKQALSANALIFCSKKYSTYNMEFPCRCFSFVKLALLYFFFFFFTATRGCSPVIVIAYGLCRFLPLGNLAWHSSRNYLSSGVLCDLSKESIGKDF